MSDSARRNFPPRYRRVRVPEHGHHVQGMLGQPNVQAVIDSLEDDERIVCVYPIDVHESFRSPTRPVTLEALIEQTKLYSTRRYPLSPPADLADDNDALSPFGGKH
jgi:hypothetical protein